MTKNEHHHGRTLFALGFGYFIDQGEAQSMGALQNSILRFFPAVSAGQFGLMETLRTIFETVSAPFWGYAADRFSRKKIMMLGTGIWGLWTIAVGFAPNFDMLLILRAVSGLGLGCLMPATFSLLADHFPQARRGMAMGVIGLVGMLGTIVGVLVLGLFTAGEMWRWGFACLGLASVISGVVIWLFVDEPPRGSAEPELAGIITHADESRYKINVRDMLSTLRIPTIWVAIAQGVSGTVPWVVMGIYFIKWMITELGYAEGTTLSHPKGSAHIIFAAILLGSAISSLIGGLIGDYAEKISPKYGRTIIGQFSVFSGVPLTYVLFTQGANLSFLQMFGLAFFTALMIGWPGRGAKEPMMQAVTLPELRSSAYAVVQVVEGGLSAFGGWIAGSLIDSLGMTQAMLWTIPFPWIICGLFFSLFYFTYPRDAAWARQRIAGMREELISAHQGDS